MKLQARNQYSTKAGSGRAATRIHIYLKQSLSSLVWMLLQTYKHMIELHNLEIKQRVGVAYSVEDNLTVPK